MHAAQDGGDDVALAAVMERINATTLAGISVASAGGGEFGGVAGDS